MSEMTFGEWLSEELKDRGWSKADLARAAGISPPHITRIVNGDQMPGNEVIVAIARALDLPPDEVFRRVAGLPLKEETPDLGEMVTIFLTVSPDIRREILDFARFKVQQKRRRSSDL